MQVPDKWFYSAREIAELLGVSYPKVLIWIKSNELRASNICHTNEQRGRWTVARQDLVDFLNSRSNSPQKETPRKKKKRNRSDSVKRFF